MYPCAASIIRLPGHVRLIGGVRLGGSSIVLSNRGLVGHWPFDTNTLNWTTDVAQDTSGSGNNGQMIAMSTTTSPVAGEIGQALQFDGTSQWIAISDAASLRPAAITVSAWIKVSSSVAQRAVIAEKWYDGSVRGYGIEITNQNCPFQIAFRYSDVNSGNGEHTACSGVTPAVGTWYFVTATYDAALGLATIYVNGVADGTNQDTASNSLEQPTSPLGIGAANDGGTWNYLFPGTIDDVRIYNRALSGAEVQQLYDIRN
jgi:hypothetical protein